MNIMKKISRRKKMENNQHGEVIFTKLRRLKMSCFFPFSKVSATLCTFCDD